MKKLLAILISLFLLVGCTTTSEADRASDNLSKAAERFQVERRIVFLNGITDQVPLTVEGFCSVERANGQLDVICKVEDDKVERTSLGLSDNMSYVITQLEAERVDFYRPKIIFRPKSFIPDFDLATEAGE